MKAQYRIALLMAFFVGKAFCQSAKVTDLPVIIPPSPTVGALLKFNDVPVSNYTGIPDISIPVYGITSHDQNIGVGLALKYHPSGAELNSVASWVGSGWSLDGAGVIARTVRGLPDEYYKITSGGNMKGIRHQDNKYQDFFGTDAIFTTLYAPGTDFEKEKFFWEAYEKGFQDTEYDIYNFSFFNYSGSFYVNKLGYVVPLFVDSNLVITFDEPNHSFTIVDDNGYKYIFDVTETTREFSASHSTYWAENAPTDDSFTPNKDFISAYQLSSVVSPGNETLLAYGYKTSTESFSDGMHTSNYITNYAAPLDVIGPYSWGHYHNWLYPAPTYMSILPREQSTISFKNIQTKKLSKINVIGKAHINFITETGRQDFDNPDSAVRLKEVNITNWTDTITQIKKVTLGYSYLGTGKRLFLNSVTQKNGSNAIEGKYSLYYQQNDLLTPNYMPGKDAYKDAWGYYRGPVSDGVEHKTSSYYCTTGVLQKMALPTGGCEIFDFESNTYSYNGVEALDNFDENPDNFYDEEHIMNFSSTNSMDCQTLPLTLHGTVYSFDLFPLYPSVDSSVEHIISLKKNGNLIQVGCLPSNPGCHTNFIFSPGDSYELCFANFISGMTKTASVRVVLHIRKSPEYQYLYGGGLRIKRIGYFKNDVLQTYYEHPEFNDPDIIPETETGYKYNFFDNAYRSSGSLTFDKPLFRYKILHKRYVTQDNDPNLDAYFNYDVITNFNNLSPIKTKGSDVGYKNITVTKNGFDEGYNGKQTFAYTSPIDYPENSAGLKYPFFEAKGLDYKRGLLLEEKTYDKRDSILVKTTNQYEYEEYTTRTGVKIVANKTCAKSAFLSDYQEHDHHGETGEWQSFNCCYNNLPNLVADGLIKAQLDMTYPPGPFQPTDDNSIFCCGYPTDYMKLRKVEKSFGLAKLMQKNTVNYFYDSTAATGIGIAEKTSYAYNSVNKKVKQTITELATGAILKTDVFYPYDVLTTTSLPGAALSAGQLDVLEDMRGPGNHIVSSPIQTDSYKNGQLLSRQRTLYKNWPGGLFLPEIIQLSKGANDLETRVKYNLLDNFGNPLEVQLDGGTKVSYIWGYYQTQPVAKIENASYSDLLATGLIPGIQAASNTGSESQLLTKLEELRNDGILSGSMIVTFTYIPLVGVSTVTDARGTRATYHYDPFGRLEDVRNKDGNLLSENQYHYRTQN